MYSKEMNGHGEKYSRLKEIVLAALLSTKTLEEAAQKSGVSVSTLRRWLKIPDFRKDLEEERRHVLEMAASGLSEAVTDAIRVLRNKFNYPSDLRSQMAAATAILNMYSKEMQRYDAQRRLTALEQKVADRQPESTEHVPEENECCGDDMKEVDVADTPDSLPEHQTPTTEAAAPVSEQMNAGGGERGCAGNDPAGPSDENTAQIFSLLKRRVE
jgi:hypothetical protein